MKTLTKKERYTGYLIMLMVYKMNTVIKGSDKYIVMDKIDANFGFCWNCRAIGLIYDMSIGYTQVPCEFIELAEERANRGFYWDDNKDRITSLESILYPPTADARREIADLFTDDTIRQAYFYNEPAKITT